MKTGDVRALLRKRFGPPEYAIMFEVSNAAGFDRSRSADAVAMSLWPSRGLAVHGFEIKVSRSDWQRELKNPAKAESIARYCDRWWIVGAPGIISVGEVPEGWGYLEVVEGRLVTRREAPKNAPLDVLDRGFIASMLRRASEADASEVAAHVEKAVSVEREALKRRVEEEVLRRAGAATDDKQTLEALSKACGMSVHKWLNTKKLGGAMVAALYGLPDIDGAIERMERVTAGLRDVQAALASPRSDTREVG